MAKCLNNLLTGEKFYDSLHLRKATKIQDLDCNNAKLCNGASMTMYGLEEEVANVDYTHKKTKEDMFKDALLFVEECCDESGLCDDAKSERLAKVKAEMKLTGTFYLTTDELEMATKIAWRNSPRCPGRIQWNNLKLRDFRHIYDVESAFEALCDHISYSTNNGNIKPAITIFPQRRPGQTKDPIRIWNKFLISHAGYKVGGKVIGDQANIKFTQLCTALGWRGKGGHFDVLPIVLSSASDGGQPRYFTIPDELVLKIKLQHPRYPKLSELDLQWYALPAVSSMSLNACDGVVFPATAFSGWYSLTEVAVRNMLDEQRYALTSKLCSALDIEDKINDQFAKDRVATEMCAVVLHSFNAKGVSIVDHHTQSQQFMEFFRQEHHLRGGCPADWVWICPPVSGSLTEVFHQEMLNYLIKPCFNYQKPLVHHFGKQGRSKITLRVLLIGMKFFALLTSKMLKKRKRVVVYYATETGTARRLAKDLRNTLKRICINPILINMDSVSIDSINQNIKESHVTLSLFVVSTFGSGSSPNNVKDLEGELRSISTWRHAPDTPLGRYGVFALGSSAYPDTFCAFGDLMDKTLKILGGQRALPMAKGDEAGGKQLVVFRSWTKQVEHILESYGHFSVERERQLEWHGTQRCQSDIQNYGGIHERDIYQAQLVSKKYLSDRVLLLEIDISYGNFNFDLKSGDHLAIFPWNPMEAVQRIMKALALAEDKPGHLVKDGAIYGPVSTVKSMLLKFYDICGPINSDFLESLGIAQNDKGLDYADLKVKPSKWQIFDLVPDFRVDTKSFLSSLEPIKPRLYSLSNDPVNNNIVELVVTLNALDESKDVLGLCSQYFKTLEKGTSLYCSPHPSHIFDIAIKRPDLPVLMVANGSGIAPFRAIWQSRHRMGARPKDTRLLYGCRTEDDNLFALENHKTHIRTAAFSRSKFMTKTYVQDLLKEGKEGEELFMDIVLVRRGCVLICGTTSMAQGVKSAISLILQSTFGAESAKILNTLQQEGRYQEEIFT